MKPSDLYKLTPIKISHDLYYLTNDWHDHLPEINGSRLDDVKADNQKLIEIRIYFDPYIDGDRCCTIGAAFFRDIPVMIFRHAGRDGHDLYDRFITDKTFFHLMVAYIQRDLYSADVPEENDIINEAQDLNELNEFYSHYFNTNQSIETKALVEHTTEEYTKANDAVSAIIAMACFGMRNK